MSWGEGASLFLFLWVVKHPLAPENSSVDKHTRIGMTNKSMMIFQPSRIRVLPMCRNDE